MGEEGARRERGWGGNVINFAKIKDKCVGGRGDEDDCLPFDVRLDAIPVFVCPL